MNSIRSCAAVIALCLAAAAAQAKGLPYAVESLQKAQQIAKQGASKHVLVFYTSEN
jgi:hypothetical protein